MKSTKIGAIIVLLLTMLPGGGSVTGFTPYQRFVPPSEFLQGAAVDASRPLDLARMRRQFNINTINAYGVTAANIGPLQQAAAAQGMRLVVRLEEYDPATFAFRAEDASALVERYAGVLERLRPEVVAYVLINMPVDDPRVRGRENQASYATEAVGLVRRAAPAVPVYI
jgi:hypothetical protein